MWAGSILVCPHNTQYNMAIGTEKDVHNGTPQNTNLVISNLNSDTVMTSRQIAESTSKDHFHVLRDIRLIQQELGESKFGLTSSYKDQQGKTRPEILLNHTEIMTLITGYNSVLRFKVIQRLEQLEKSKVKPSYQIDDPIERAERWIEEAKQRHQLRLELERNQEKADFADRLIESEDSLDLATASKAMNLGYGRNTLFRKLRELKVLGSDNNPYQSFVDRGYFTVKEFPYTRIDGTKHISTQTQITARGQMWILKKLKELEA